MYIVEPHHPTQTYGGYNAAQPSRHQAVCNYSVDQAPYLAWPATTRCCVCSIDWVASLQPPDCRFLHFICSRAPICLCRGLQSQTACPEDQHEMRLCSAQGRNHHYATKVTIPAASQHNGHGDHSKYVIVNVIVICVRLNELVRHTGDKS